MAGLFDALSSDEDEDYGTKQANLSPSQLYGRKEGDDSPSPERAAVGREPLRSVQLEEPAASPYAPHAAVKPEKQQTIRAMAEARDAAMQLRRRLRSEKELRARAEERLAVANSSVDELTAALAHAKRKAQAGSGGARHGSATSAVMLAEASAAKSRSEAEALRRKLDQQEAAVLKHQRARKAAEATTVQLIEDKAALMRETEQLRADLEVAQLDAAPAESVRVLLNDAMSERKRATASTMQARRARAEAISNRRVAAARLTSMRATMRGWRDVARQSAWIKQKVQVLSEEAAAAVVEVEREREHEVAALNQELEDALSQLSAEHAAEVADLNAQLQAQEDLHQKAQTEIADLRRQLDSEAASSRRAEQLATRVSDEVNDLRDMVGKAERLKHELRISEERAEAAEMELRSLRRRLVAAEEEHTDRRKLQFEAEEAQAEIKRLKARLGARSSSAGAAHALAMQQIEEYKVQVEEQTGRVAALEQQLKKDRASHQQLVESEIARRMLMVTSVLATRKKRCALRKWLAFSRQRYACIPCRIFQFRCLV